jgi:hypothetical protein
MVPTILSRELTQLKNDTWHHKLLGRQYYPSNAHQNQMQTDTAGASPRTPSRFRTSRPKSSITFSSFSLDARSA